MGEAVYVLCKIEGKKVKFSRHDVGRGSHQILNIFHILFHSGDAVNASELILCGDRKQAVLIVIFECQE